jgi:hypothetical protein
MRQNPQMLPTAVAVEKLDIHKNTMVLGMVNGQAQPTKRL